MIMMEDIYLEYMIKKKKTGGQLALIAVIIGLSVLFTAFFLAGTFFVGVSMQQAGTGIGQMVSFVGLLLIAGVWYVAYLLLSMQNVEYEYILTNSEIDIDKIMSKKGRKKIVSFDFKNINICAGVLDSEHNHDYKNIKTDKLISAVGDEARGNIYFADFTDESGEKTRVLFQPTSKMINSAKKFNPRNVFVMEE